MMIIVCTVVLENGIYVSPIFEQLISYATHVRRVSLELSFLLESLRMTYRACIYDKS